MTREYFQKDQSVRAFQPDWGDNMRSLDVADILWRVGQLASVPFQERYVINGTLEEHSRDDELLQDVDALEFRIFRPENSNLLNDSQIETLKALFRDIALFDWHQWEIDRETMNILAHPRWIALRATANRALKEFGHDAETMSLADIEALAK